MDDVLYTGHSGVHPESVVSCICVKLCVTYGVCAVSTDARCAERMKPPYVRLYTLWLPRKHV